MAARSERVPIFSLHPSLPTPATKSITSIVTILWPYSSSTRTCALLLAEPDFRLRRRRGQVRVQFFGDAASAIATSQVGIGDKVILKLAGVKWLQTSGEEEVVRTPGKSVEWELGFQDRLGALVLRDGREFARLDVQRGTPEPGPETMEEDVLLPDTPSRIVGKFSGQIFPSSTWSSPAFLKRARLSMDSLSGNDYDLFADEDGYGERKGRKRRRKSFKDVGVWTYMTRTPSPEKGDAMSVDEELAAGSAEEAPAAQTLELPRTPVSARSPPAEFRMDRGNDLVPAKPRRGSVGVHDETAELPDESTKRAQEAIEEALERQYVEEVTRQLDAMEDTEEKTAEELPEEPRDRLPARSSLQHAKLTRMDPPEAEESLPSAIPEMPEMISRGQPQMPFRAEDYAGDTEPESEDEPQVVEMADITMSSTEVDSEEEEQEISGFQFRRAIPRRQLRNVQSSTEETTGEVQESESKRAEAQHSEEESLEGKPSRHADRRTRTSHRYGVSDIAVPGNTEDDEAREEEERMEVMDDRLKQEPARGLTEQPAMTMDEPPAAVQQAGFIMPPPANPQFQTGELLSASPPKSPIGPVNAPSTPLLQPVTSAILPLPSPFPGTTDSTATSYMDSHPSWSGDGASSVAAATSDGRQHEAEAVVELSSQEVGQVFRSPQSEPTNPPIDPALYATQDFPAHALEEAQNESAFQKQHPFGLDGAALSAIRSSRARNAPEHAEIVDLQDTQLNEAISAPQQAMGANIDRQGMKVAAEKTDGSASMHSEPAKSAPSPVIHGLAEQGRTSPEFKGVMKAVAAEEPTVKELREFQDTVNELTEQLEPQDKAQETAGDVSSVIEEAPKSVQRVQRPTSQGLPPPLLSEGIEPVTQLETTQDIGSSIPQHHFTFGDESYIPSHQDDDWDMLDAAAEPAAETQTVPYPTRLAVTGDKIAEREKTPEAVPPKSAVEGPSAPDSILAKPSEMVVEKPLSSQPVDIVDLGSESDEADEPMADAPLITTETMPKVDEQVSEGESHEPSQLQLGKAAQKPQDSSSEYQVLSSSPPPSQTRRKPQQLDIEVLDLSRVEPEPTLSQSRKRDPRASQEAHTASGIAQRVLRRRRRTEVKDSECEWDSNASISTQHPSSPSEIPSREDFELSAGAVASQILGDLSQPAPQATQDDERQIPERPTVSPLTPTASKQTIDTMSSGGEAPSEDDPHEAQNRRLESQLADDYQDLRDSSSSSPFPELNFEWEPEKKAEPIHSSIMQDDSSMMRALKTSQALPSNLAGEQVTSSPSREYEESQVRIRDGSPSRVTEAQPSSPLKGPVQSESRTRASIRESVVEQERAEELGSSPPKTTSVARRPLSSVQSSPLKETAISSPVHVDDEVRVPVGSDSPTQVSGRGSAEQDTAQDLRSSPPAKTSIAGRLLSAVQQTLQDSTLPMTPQPSQQVSEGQPSPQQTEFDSVLPPTPQLTQTASAVANLSQVSETVEEREIIRPSAKDKAPLEEADFNMNETALVDSAQPRASQRAASPTAEDVKWQVETKWQWQPSQVSEGIRTCLSYYTPLSYISSYLNSQSAPLDILAVCTRPNKLPVRAATGPRDYHTVFRLTDPSLTSNTSVLAQVFRPWKAALPDMDVGDVVLLRSFVIKSRRGKAGLISGNESAWCVFRYGHKRRAESAEAKEEGAGTGGETNDERRKGKRKSDIMDSLKPIWADVTSGLWGDVTGAEPSEPSLAVERPALERQHSESCATREECHGPPVEVGDEERKEAKRLREWWVGVGKPADGTGQAKDGNAAPPLVKSMI